jgi:putative flippase GtrA
MTKLMGRRLQLRRAQRFAISGLLVTGLHVLVAAAFLRFVAPRPSIANGLAFAVATLFSYAINTAWSFSGTFDRAGFLRFVSVSIIGCGLAMSVSGLADFYGLSHWIGIAFVVAVVPPVTFLLHTFWTYR